MHWTDQFASSGPIDRLVHAITDPVSGQPDLKGTPVRVAAIAEILARQAVAAGELAIPNSANPSGGQRSKRGGLRL